MLLHAQRIACTHLQFHANRCWWMQAHVCNELVNAHECMQMHADAVNGQCKQMLHPLHACLCICMLPTWMHQTWMRHYVKVCNIMLSYAARKNAACIICSTKMNAPKMTRYVFHCTLKECNFLKCNLLELNDGVCILNASNAHVCNREEMILKVGKKWD